MQRRHLAEFQTEMALSFPSRPPVPVSRPTLTSLSMNNTHFTMSSGDGWTDFQTTQSDFKPLPLSPAQIIRPVAAVWTSPPETQRPDTTYTSSFIRRRVPPVLRAKEPADTGVGSSLNGGQMDFGSSYHEQFQYRRSPAPLPLQSIEKQRIQFSSVAMGDREKILDKRSTYSCSFRPSGADRGSLLPEINQSQPMNLRELPADEWMTTSDEFCAHRCDPVHLESKNPNLSSVFKGEEVNRERLMTTNQSFFPQGRCAQFPGHVDGPGVRTLSSVRFGRPRLAGRFYSTTSQEQFPPKQALRAEPRLHPPSHVLFEQESDRMLSTVQKDFVPLKSRRPSQSPSHVQKVKESHIRPENSEQDFQTTHNEAFVAKPYCRAFLDRPPLQHISHLRF